MTSRQTRLFVFACVLSTGCPNTASFGGDGGVADDHDAAAAGSPSSDLDAGVVGPAPTGTIGPRGGSVSRLLFAVVGDTRPGSPDDTARYPTAIIQKIYADIETLSPRPQFVVTTGDYMFATPGSGESGKQIAIYKSAADQFTGPIFAAMGNHECTGATAGNCINNTTSNYTDFMNTLVKPLGQSKPYYTIPISDVAGKWTAKIVIAACNYWDTTQESWLRGELAKPTTYTFVVRHEPKGTQGPPCVSAMDSILAQSTYDLFIVGHTHTFSHSNKEVIVGNGGAPITGGGTYGFATIEQQSTGGFLVTQYEYAGPSVVGTFGVQ